MRTFTAFGKEFFYYQELGERTIEIPMADEVRKQYDSDNLIEIGNVLARQIAHKRISAERQFHRVIDKYDTDPWCEKIDARDFNFHGRFVLTISTLEHFGMPDYGSNENGGEGGEKCLLNILNDSLGYFITFPVGYNRNFDNAVSQFGIELTMFKQVEGPTNAKPETLPVWEQLPAPDWAIKYGDPFHYANAVAVISNVPWILNHEAIHRGS